MNNRQTILIVDDEKSNIDMLINVFRNTTTNYTILPVLSGEKALQAAQKRKVDLILLDIMMPQMDGYEVCRRLKAENLTKDTPIIFVTAHTDAASIEKMYALGANDYVTKPFCTAELLARVNLTLKLQQTMEKLKYYTHNDADSEETQNGNTNP
jgi:CheY-like chemotaxis protein